jgi:uncharacterized damage-inducible protein DinB
MFPNILERLRGTPARIGERIESVSSEMLTNKSGGRWSIQENIGHLLDLEPLWYGRGDDILAGVPEMRQADLKNIKTHAANHNSKALRELLLDFREARIKLVSRLEALDERAVQQYSLHPRLKTKMRVIDLAFFIAEHDDHHLAAITELIADK